MLNFIIAIFCIAIPVISIGYAINRYFKPDQDNQDTILTKEQEQVKVEMNELEAAYHEVTTNDVINIIYEHLTEEGYRPNRELFSIHFKLEGKGFDVFFSEKDHNHFSIYARFDYDKDDFTNIIILLNELIPDYKLVKGFVNQDFLCLMTDTLVYELHNVIPAFSRMMNALLNAIEEFRKELSIRSLPNLN